MQKSCLPLLISATVCGTLLAVDVSMSRSSFDMSGSHDADQRNDNNFWVFDLNSFTDTFTISVSLETLDNGNTDANNRTTLALASGYGFTDKDGIVYYFGAASGSHKTYDIGLSDENTLAATMGLTVPFSGAGASAGASALSLAATASTADHFLDAGSTQNGTVGVGGSMRLMDGLSIGAGIKAGRTATKKGGSTDLVGADSFDYNVVKAGVKYVSGDLTFNIDGSRTGTSEAVGAKSTDSVDSTHASVEYAVASGVTAILGYTTNETENGVQTNDGSAWYIGANMAS